MQYFWKKHTDPVGDKDGCNTGKFRIWGSLLATERLIFSHSLSFPWPFIRNKKVLVSGLHPCLDLNDLEKLEKTMINYIRIRQPALRGPHASPGNNELHCCARNLFAWLQVHTFFCGIFATHDSYSKSTCIIRSCNF